jgi:hypothetical protein
VENLEVASGWGLVTWEQYGPGGQLKGRGQVGNQVTQVGEQMYAERGAGVSGAPAAPTGMKLGTGSTAPAKTGAGAALVTYLTNSHQAFDATFPSSALLAAINLTSVTATAATDLFTKTAHGLTDGRRVTLTSPPTGLAVNVPYFVINSTANTFQLALTPGGSAVDVTADSTTVTVDSAAVRKITYKVTFAAGKATSGSAITEAAIVIDALADATSTSGNTAARVLLSGIASKGASDIVIVTWDHFLLF